MLQELLQGSLQGGICPALSIRAAIFQLFAFSGSCVDCCSLAFLSAFVCTPMFVYDTFGDFFLN